MRRFSNMKDSYSAARSIASAAHFPHRNNGILIFDTKAQPTDLALQSGNATRPRLQFHPSINWKRPHQHNGQYRKLLKSFPIAETLAKVGAKERPIILQRPGPVSRRASVPSPQEGTRHVLRVPPEQEESAPFVLVDGHRDWFGATRSGPRSTGMAVPQTASIEPHRTVQPYFGRWKHRSVGVRHYTCDRAIEVSVGRTTDRGKDFGPPNELG